MTLIQLYYFQKTAQLQHISKAAEMLCIAQPSLSTSLSNLEKELGVPLFEKSGRGILLTKQGTVFLEYANHILSDISHAKKAMANLAKEQEARIRLGYVAPLGPKYIPQTIRKFLNTKQNHNIRFELEHASTKNMIEKLKQDEFDLIFCAEIKNEPEFIQIPIIEQPVVLIAPNSHPLSQLQQVFLSQIRPYPLISYPESSPMTKPLHELFRQYDYDPEISYRAPDEQTIASLVAADFGIALVAHVELLEQMNVHVIPLSDISITRKIYLTYRKNKKLSDPAKRLIQFVTG